MNALAFITNNNAAAPYPLPQSTKRSEAAFADLLNGGLATSQEHRSASTLRAAAEQMIASTFITPVLASLRENSTAVGPFAPSIAEQRFGPLLDQHFADRVVQASNFSLVDAIVQRYLPTDAPPQPLRERTIA